MVLWYQQLTKGGENRMNSFLKAWLEHIEDLDRLKWSLHPEDFEELNSLKEGLKKLATKAARIHGRNSG